MKKTEDIRISVAMCTYNGEKYIREQLESILDQDSPVDEIVIGDDGSADRTVAIAEKILSGSGVRYEIVRNEKNLGFRKNFEQTIALTHGDIIFLSDQDDIWMKQKVRVMREHFLRDPGCLLVFSNAEVVDENRTRQRISLWDSLLLKEEKISGADWKRIFLKGWYVTGAATAIRRKLFEEARPFPETCYHDAWLGMLSSLHDGTQAEPARLIEYRQHGDNQVGVLYSGRGRWNKRIQVLRTAGETQIEAHRLRAEMYQEMRAGFAGLLSADPDFCGELESCICFNREMASLGSLGCLRRIRLLAVNYRQGNFDRFARSSATLRGDLLYAFGKRVRADSRR